LFAARMVREGGYLIIDDTAWARWAVQAEAVCESVVEKTDKQQIE
jgi:hypothetical protein